MAKSSATADEFDIRTMMREEAQGPEEKSEAPIPSDSVSLKKGILSMLGDASVESISSVFGYLAGKKGDGHSRLPDQEQMIDFIYDELDDLDDDSLSALYTILCKFE